MIAAAPVGIFVTDEAGHCVLVNEKWSALTGLSSEAARESGWVRALHPDDRERVSQEWYESAKKGHAFESEYRLRRGDNLVVWVLGQSHAIDGGYIGTLTEIGDLIATRDRLVEANAMYRSIAEQSPVAGFIADKEGHATFVGDSWTELTGQPVQDALGARWLDVVADADAERVRDLVARAIRAREPFEVAYRVRNSSREVRWLEGSARPIFAPDGHLVSYVGSVFDVTEKMETERSLRSQAAALESDLEELECEKRRISAENRELVRQVREDGLTKLPNRVGFAADLERRIDLARYTARPMALLYVDLDDFKRINDVSGHGAGDAVLVAFAHRAQDVLRPSDRIFRLGGDEFGIAVSDLRRPEDAAVVARNLIAAMEVPLPYRDTTLRIQGSIGIAVAPSDAESADSLIRRADQAMYHAKRQGGSRFQFFRGETDQIARGRMRVRHDLQLAVERGEFVLHYQPQVDLRTSTWLGAEALLRWNHPERGLLSPAEFVEVAESSGQIVEIGEWAFAEAAAESRRWSGSQSPFRMAVNVSYRQLLDRRFVSQVESILTRTACDPRAIEVELTETWAVQNLEIALERLRPLREMGLRISIDDFGVGYSNLAALGRLGADTVKVDRQFIAGIETNPIHQSIVHALCLISEQMGFSLVAEGIEQEAEREWLLAHGVSVGQGYLFARPMPLDALAADRRATDDRRRED